MKSNGNGNNSNNNNNDSNNSNFYSDWVTRNWCWLVPATMITATRTTKIKPRQTNSMVSPVLLKSDDDDVCCSPNDDNKDNK